MAEKASLNGLEPLTVRLEGGCSIQLSYKDSAIMIAKLPRLDKDPAHLFSEDQGKEFQGALSSWQLNLTGIPSYLPK